MAGSNSSFSFSPQKHSLMWSSDDFLLTNPGSPARVLEPPLASAASRLVRRSGTPWTTTLTKVGVLHDVYCPIVTRDSFFLDIIFVFKDEDALREYILHKAHRDYQAFTALHIEGL